MLKPIGITNHSEARGFFGHKGRPGQRGGSLPASGGKGSLPTGVDSQHKMLIKMGNDASVSIEPSSGKGGGGGGKRSSNPAAKMRKVDNPYEIWQSSDGWEWRVLKKYQSPEKEAGNPYARWMCAVKSPFTFGSWEYGDVYVNEIKRNAQRVK